MPDAGRPAPRPTARQADRRRRARRSATVTPQAAPTTRPGGHGPREQPGRPAPQVRRGHRRSTWSSASAPDTVAVPDVVGLDEDAGPRAALSERRLHRQHQLDRSRLPARRRATVVSVDPGRGQRRCRPDTADHPRDLRRRPSTVPDVARPGPRRTATQILTRRGLQPNRSRRRGRAPPSRRAPSLGTDPARGQRRPAPDTAHHPAGVRRPGRARRGHRAGRARPDRGRRRGRPCGPPASPTITSSTATRTTPAWTPGRSIGTDPAAGSTAAAGRRDRCC